LLRHVLPHLVAPMMVIATIQVGQVILLESALSFLGLGVQPPTPSWGVMISEGRGYIHQAWWLITVPGCLLALLVISMNMVGDGLRDIVEPET
jgi:peptide/nickel transport system permease protein